MHAYCNNLNFATKHMIFLESNQTKLFQKHKEVCAEIDKKLSTNNHNLYN